MGVESEADRASFLDTDEHGVSATITASGSAAVTLPGIFEEPYSLLGDADDLEGTSSGRPTFLVQSSLLPAGSLIEASVSMTVLGSPRSYRIVEVKPDGTGMTELRLMES